MIDPRYIKWVLWALSGLISTAIAIIQFAGADQFSEFLSQSLDRGYQYFVIFIATLSTVAYYLNLLLFEERAKARMKESGYKFIQKRNQFLEDRAVVDFITGIPNYDKWKIDVNKFCNSSDPHYVFQMIFIDFDEFSYINKNYGYEVGDQVIGHIAQSIERSMRRNEYIYKKPHDELSPLYEQLSDQIESNSNKHSYEKIFEMLWRRVYRKYNGGDEFIILISGPEYEAIGFLNRLSESLTDKYIPEIERDIIQDKLKDGVLLFHAAVGAMYPMQDPETALRELENMVISIKDSDRGSRVFWKSRRKSTDGVRTGERDFVPNLYKRAEEIFKK